MKAELERAVIDDRDSGFQQRIKEIDDASHGDCEG
jgi:hypothetical protein